MCGETSDDSTLDSSSRCSSTSNARESIVANGSPSPVLFVDFRHVNNKEKHISEIYWHTTALIQGTWTVEGIVHTRFSECRAATIIQVIWNQWSKKEKVKRLLKKELRASQTIANAWRTWAMREKGRKEKTAARIVQDAWRLWITAEKQRQNAENENLAAVTIQTSWRNYYAKVSAMKAVEKERADFTVRQGLERRAAGLAADVRARGRLRP